MSNLVTNGDLYYPTLNSNTSLSGINMGTTPITGWTNPTNSSSLTLCNGVIQGFLSPAYQYVYLVGTAPYIQQTINISQIGLYSLSLRYASSPSYNTSSNLKINFGGVQVYNLISTSTAWNTFNLQINVTSIGSKILNFQGGAAATAIAITNISLTSNTPAAPISESYGALYLPPLNFSSTKLFNVEDYNYQDSSISLHTADNRYLRIGNGVTGPAGAVGASFYGGEQGLQGIQGETGSQGIQGDQGSQGI